MSSHREAPEISKDPVADSTDVYAFVSPDQPDTVTLIANYIPFQKPDSGPNFFEFADDVLYDIRISNGGDSISDIIYRFRFTTTIRNKKTFLYNVGPISSLTDSNWNRPQTYSLSMIRAGHSEKVLARGLTVPPVNVGKRSTPHYSDLAEAAVHTVGGRKVFAGQRADAFFVDLGSIFDLGALRPFNMAHVIPMATADGVNGLQSFNVHTLALQVPISEVTRHRDVPTDVASPGSVIGVWTTARRQSSRVFSESKAKYVGHGDWHSVSRLANPLFNEVIVPMAEKDKWNSLEPKHDKNYAKYVDQPELAKLLPQLYPNTFDNLAAYTKDRADLDAILLTGIPNGVIGGFQNYTGKVKADMVRLNVAIPPTTSNPKPLGLVDGDLAGFPNGRRVFDDVVTVELRAIAGATIPLVDPSFTPDGAATAIKDGTSNTNADLLDVFPYLGLPGGGYETNPGTTSDH